MCHTNIIPEKSYTEKITNNESEDTQKRMRGFKRFLNTIKDHPVLRESEELRKFLLDTDYATSKSQTENENLEEDTSTVSKIVYSWWDTIKTTVTGSKSSSEPRGQEQTDFDYQSDLQKCQNLLDFVTRLHSNSISLQQLLNDEYENTRNIGTVMGNLQSSIGELEGINQKESASKDDPNSSEEEKSMDVGSSYARSTTTDVLQESTSSMDQENKNDKDLSKVIISMEEGIDIIRSAISAIERRNSYKKAIENLNDDISALNSSGEEKNREKEQKTKKVDQIRTDLIKIDQNLRDEISQRIETIERKTQGYISKLVKARKTHLGIQKSKWASISNKYSSIKA